MREYVEGSGFRIRSESSIEANPTIDEPSSFGRPSAIWSWVKVLAEIVVWWNLPVSPVNCKSINKTSS